MFIFAIFILKANFKQSHLKRIGVVLTSWNLFEFPLLRILDESCFKALGGLLHEYFQHWNIFAFANIVQKIDAEQSQSAGNDWSLLTWVVFIAGVSKKLFQISKSALGQMILSLKHPFFLNFHKNSTLSNHSFTWWTWH